MLFRRFVILAFVFFFCTACFVFSHHRLASLLCSSVLMLATVSLVGSDFSSHRLFRERYPSEIDCVAEREPDTKGGTLFQAALIVPPPVVESAKSEEVVNSVHRENATPTLRRSVSYTLPRPKYFESDFLLGGDDDDDDPFGWAKRSTAGFVSQLVSAKGNGSAENLEKAPSLTAEQVNQLADAFIARCHEKMRLERQKSLMREQGTV